MRQTEDGRERDRGTDLELNPLSILLVLRIRGTGKERLRHTATLEGIESEIKKWRRGCVTKSFSLLLNRTGEKQVTEQKT